MMHYEQYVVAITDPKGKSFREYDAEKLGTGRKSKVYIPFDSEYKLLIKNNSDRRIKLTIDIDGTSVSGQGGLIMDAHKSEFLERFVDVPKKFLFVRKNDERVSDPSNMENGLLRVQIEKEFALSTYIINNTPQIPWSSDQYNRGPWIGGPGTTPIMYTSQNASYSVHDGSMTCSNGIGSINSCYTSSIKSLKASNTLRQLNEETGATVEGSDSNQAFTTTTWAGTDGPTYEFVFKLLGQMSMRDHEEYLKYLELKKKFG